MILGPFQSLFGNDVVIENLLSEQQSRGWKSAVEPARNVPYEAFVPRATTRRLSGGAGTGGCFKFLTADFHPRLCRGIFDCGLCHF